MTTERQPHDGPDVQDWRQLPVAGLPFFNKALAGLLAEKGVNYVGSLADHTMEDLQELGLADNQIADVRLTLARVGHRLRGDDDRIPLLYRDLAKFLNERNTNFGEILLLMGELFCQLGTKFVGKGTTDDPETRDEVNYCVRMGRMSFEGLMLSPEFRNQPPARAALHVAGLLFGLQSHLSRPANPDVVDGLVGTEDEKAAEEAAGPQLTLVPGGDPTLN